MRFSPFNTYAARDGEVAIGAGTPDDWTALLDVMGRQDLLTRNDFMSASWRIANNSQVDDVVSAWTQMLSVADIIARLNGREIPCSPIRDIEALVAWPHLRAREMITELVHPRIVAPNGPLAAAFPLKFSRTPTTYESAAPLCRQHNDEIYRDLLGMSEGELRALAAEGVI
jgi:crotonobetainyl-CoA:carnitine CoA-transferase CaiB-like acyl-CoA transferase